MSVSVAEVLQIPGLQGIKIAAGISGISNRVSWVNIVELLDELNQLRENELLLTTGFDLESYAPDYRILLHRLLERSLSALAIKPGLYLREIPAAFLQEADEQGFPILVIPETLSFSEISRTIISLIKQKEYEEIAEQAMACPAVKACVPEFDPRRLISEGIGCIGLPGTGEERYRAVLCRIDGWRDALQDQPILDKPDGKESVLSFVRGQICEVLAGCFFHTEKEDMLILIPHSSIIYIEDLREILSSIIQNTKGRYTLAVSFGVSNVCPDASALQNGLFQAREALEVGGAIRKNGFVTLYENIELYRIFLDIPQRDALIDFSERTLKKISDYDRWHGTELLRTLEAYFRNDRNIKKTSDLLGIHRHTLKNRLQKVEEITRISIKNEGRFQMEFAITLKHLYRIKF